MMITNNWTTRPHECVDLFLWFSFKNHVRLFFSKRMKSFSSLFLSDSDCLIKKIIKIFTLWFAAQRIIRQFRRFVRPTELSWNFPRCQEVSISAMCWRGAESSWIYGDFEHFSSLICPSYFRFCLRRQRMS